MHLRFSLALIVVASVASFASSANTALADSIEADNWRLIYMNQGSVGGFETLGYYSLHTNNQENSLFHFDLSTYSGQTATGDGQLVLTFNPASGFSPGPISLMQLNSYNAIVDLDIAGSYYRDSPNATPGSLPWINNSGTPLSNLNYNSSVFDISTLIETLAPPPIITTGSTISFTIPQATIQAWLDGSLPSTLILTANVNSPASFGYFVTTPGDRPELTFTAAAVPEPSSFALAAFGLASLGWFGIRRRKG